MLHPFNNLHTKYVFFYKNKKKNNSLFLIDKCLYVDFSRLSLKKISRINIYSLIEKALGAFPLSLPSDELRPIVCASHCRQKRELTLSTHHTYHIDHQYILNLNSHSNDQSYDQYAHTRHLALPCDCRHHIAYLLTFLTR